MILEGRHPFLVLFSNGERYVGYSRHLFCCQFLHSCDPQFIAIEVLVTLTMCFCMLAMHPVAALMEFCYRRRLMNPAYELIENCGPAHRKTFKYKVLS